MEIEDTLKNLGLSKDEIKTYIELLKLGSSLASKIAEKTKLNRSFTYQILDNLIKKGFVTYVIKENRRYYKSVEPTKILDLFREREDKLMLIIPKLEGYIGDLEKKTIVEVLEGVEGIKTILKDILRVKQEWLALGSGKSTEILPYYVNHWEKERSKLKINAKIIISASQEGIKRAKELEKFPLTEIRKMPEEYSSPTSTWVYGDRIVLVVWGKENPLAVRIIDKKITENYRNHFSVLWKNAKTLKTHSPSVFHGYKKKHKKF